MRGVNIVMIGGNLGGDPDVKYTASGDAVTIFSIALSEKFKKNGEAQEKVEWVKIVCFKQLAEICGKYLAKGSGALVQGRLRIREFEDRDGNQRKVTEIIADKVHFLSGNKKEGSEEGASTGGGISDDEPPF